jgi:hypothetical protein
LWRINATTAKNRQRSSASIKHDATEARLVEQSSSHLNSEHRVKHNCPQNHRHDADNAAAPSATTLPSDPIPENFARYRSKLVAKQDLDELPTVAGLHDTR